MLVPTDLECLKFAQQLEELVRTALVYRRLDPPR
ncbi:hypothetical protein PC114_g22502 [Phytophthora cactorum]|nr:hypothetical protein PC114_g22502 [Phytophthora cactorum]KAG3036597.1 hypothetical protein PC120_g3 [Phytophthora cactorum]KAG3101409.1 hypothetical protein PC121_g1484 [Phytophthora cactorum]KAG4064697.1 hypothetical protein PC123_g550 [Phytophthora cactorum]